MALSGVATASSTVRSSRTLTELVGELEAALGEASTILDNLEGKINYLDGKNGCAACSGPKPSSATSLSDRLGEACQWQREAVVRMGFIMSRLADIL